MRRTGHPRRRRAGRTAHGPTTCCLCPRRPRPPAPRGPPPAVPSRSPTVTSAPPPWGHRGKASGNGGAPQPAAHRSESVPNSGAKGSVVDLGPFEGRPESGTLATFKWEGSPVWFSPSLLRGGGAAGNLTGKGPSLGRRCFPGRYCLGPRPASAASLGGFPARTLQPWREGTRCFPSTRVGTRVARPSYLGSHYPAFRVEEPKAALRGWQESHAPSF